MEKRKLGNPRSYNMKSDKLFQQNERRSAIVLIEFQREWLDPVEGGLGRLMQDQNQFAESQHLASQALEAARTARMHIIHVPCLFEPGYPELGGGRHFHLGMFAAIPKAGTWIGKGRAFATGFEPRSGEFVASGRIGASAFSHSNLDAFLRNNGITSLFLAGYALHVVTICKVRGQPLAMEDGTKLIVTVHPSALLRIEDEVERHAAYRSFVADLKVAAAANSHGAAINRPRRNAN